MLINNLTYLKASFSRLSNDWQTFFMENCASELLAIDAKLAVAALQETIYPPASKIFRAFELIKSDQIKVVILGQDPYHGENEANGLAFAVNPGIKLPPSLRNIYKEISLEYQRDTSIYNGELLDQWAQSGVLLLNASLSVIKDRPNSQSNLGWQVITDRIIHYLGNNTSAAVFMLWGNFARQKASLIDKTRHLVLEAPHPSPFSVHKGFFGCNHFKLANDYLQKHGKAEVVWLPKI